MKSNCDSIIIWIYVPLWLGRTMCCILIFVIEILSSKDFVISRVEQLSDYIRDRHTQIRRRKWKFNAYYIIKEWIIECEREIYLCYSYSYTVLYYLYSVADKWKTFWLSNFILYLLWWRLLYFIYLVNVQRVQIILSDGSILLYTLRYVDMHLRFWDIGEKNKEISWGYI